MSSSQEIKKRAINSILWSSVEHFSAQGLGFIITLFIARLVTPEDYGLIAMLSIFMVVSQVIINSGFSNYLIQNKNRTHVDYSTVFCLNIVLGLLCYLILFLSSNGIASFYNQPLLSDVIKIYGLSLIVSSLTLVQKAILYINGEFKRLSVITIISLFISGTIAIVLAYNSWGVWALVVYYLLQSSTSSIGIWLTTKWYPTFVFSLQSAKAAFLFGSKLLAANLLSNAVTNIYTLVIGKQYQALELGFYSRGQSFAMIFPANISNMLQQATYPILCELQNDKRRLMDMFEKYLRISAFVCFPVMTLLISLGEPAIKIILTEKWLSAVFFVQILGVAYMFDPIMRLNVIILSVTGKTQLSLYSEIWKKIVLVAILFITLPWGIKWVASGVVIYSLMDLFIVTRYVRNIIPITLRRELWIIAPYFVYCFIIYLIVVVVSVLLPNDFMKIVVGVPLGGVVYLLLVKFFSTSSFNNMVVTLKTLKR